MRNYYIIKNGASTGPFSLEQLKYNAVLPETKVWYEGLPEWVEAKTLAELSELFAPIPLVYTPTAKKEGTDWGFWVIMTVIVVGVGMGFWYFTRSGDNVIVLPKTEKQRAEEQKVYYRNNWRSFVECGHVSGNHVVSGGFSDIKIQAKNKMPYTINQLTAVVEYTLKNGEKQLSTPKYFINIKPNQLSDIKDVEAQSKGIALKTKIIAIVSGEIGLNYAEN